MVKPIAGILDGQSLSVFIPHTIYEIPEHLGTQLIALNVAVEDESDTPAVHLPSDNARELPVIEGGVHVIHGDRRKKKRRAADKTST